MGSNSAMDMSIQVARGLVKRHAALTWHLRNNHFPPHPMYMIEIAEKAIDLANDGDYDTLIDLPEDVEHKDYGTSAPVSAILHSLHLWSFVRDNDEEE